MLTHGARLKAKELSPVEVVEAALERPDPELHAFTIVTADNARAEARRIEQDIAAGREVGPLVGARWHQGSDLYQGRLHRLRLLRVLRAPAQPAPTRSRRQARSA